MRPVSRKVCRAAVRKCAATPKPNVDTKVSKVSKANDNEASGCFLEEGTLDCDICLEVLHNAVNVSPCNHKFCAACIYEWSSTNNDCPKCRWPINDLSRDYLINRVVEQFLDFYPAKQRTQATLDHLDERELKHLIEYKNNSFVQFWDLSNISDEEDYEDISFGIDPLGIGRSENDTHDNLDNMQQARKAQVEARIALLRREKSERDERREAEMKKQVQVSRRSRNKEELAAHEEEPVSHRLRNRRI